MNQHPGVTCPTCGSWKSPRKIYHSDEAANGSYGKRHSTRCNECGAEFTYKPRRARLTWWERALFRKPKAVITEMYTEKEGQV